MSVAKRLERINPSEILSLVQHATNISAAGHDIIDLGISEPDFQTPYHVIQAACHALQNGKTRYTAVDDTVTLRAAIVLKFLNQNNLTYDIDQITAKSLAESCEALR